MKINKIILAVLLLLIPSLSFSQIWNQVGADIDGEAANDGSGNSVSLSADGTIVAIGAKGNNSSNGHTRVYQVSLGSWNQIGSDIDGPTFENAGASVSLSADGLTLAVGSPFGSTFNGLVRIYQFIAGTWSQVGSDIDGTVNGGVSGSSVALSADGLTVAIGAEGANSSVGLVQVYELISGTWTQVGSDINGEANGDSSGRSISLSNDGSIVAIGAPNNNSGTGHVRVYENISTVWTQIGVDIDGETTGDQSGGAVCLNGSGSILAIGATSNNSGIGHVRVYENNSGTWSQVGVDIDGVSSGEYFGTSVSLDNDGNTIVIGANELASTQTGLTRVYKNVSGSWSQLGSDIVAEAVADESGESVSISSDGLTVAIGAISNDDNGSGAGQVRVYNFFCADIATTNINGTVTSSATGATYQWLDCDNAYSVIVGETSQSFIATNTGNFAVEVTQNSCTDTSLCVNATVAGVNDNEKNIVSVYPNPTKELINIEFGNSQGFVNYTLTSIEGRVIEQKQNVTDKVISIDLSNENMGIYLLTIDNNSSINTFKIVRK